MVLDEKDRELTSANEKIQKMERRIAELESNAGSGGEEAGGNDGEEGENQD